MAFTTLWANYIHIIARRDAKIKSVFELKGRRVSVGAARSGNELNARALLGAANISYADLLQVEYIDDTRAARRSVSGGLILEFGLVLASADGWARLALVPARGLRKIERYDRERFRGNSGVSVSFGEFFTRLPLRRARGRVPFRKEVRFKMTIRRSANKSRLRSTRASSRASCNECWTAAPDHSALPGVTVRRLGKAAGGACRH